MKHDQIDTPYSKLMARFEKYIVVSMILFLLFFYVGWRVGTNNGIEIGVQTGWKQHSMELADLCHTEKLFTLLNGDFGFYQCKSISITDSVQKK